jgi:colanic acid/amylovoran/stewartan biosynthesis glycosyltransferase WcaL/AmsK/CpsK
MNRPRDPWVLHATLFMDPDRDAFVEVLARAAERFDSRLLGVRVVGSGERRPYWLVAEDSRRFYLEYRGVLATGGVGSALLARRFADRPPAAVHGHFGVVASNLGGLARRLDLPLFGSFYGYDASQASIVESRRWRKRYRRLFREAASILVEGPAMGGRVEALGCPPDRIEVVRLPVNEDQIGRCTRREPEAFVVTAAGRLVEKKGFDTAIRAFARAFEDRRDARLVIVGGGPLEAQLKRLAADEGVADRVEWRGALPFVEYNDAAAAGSVAVFPSRRAADGDAEGGAPVTLIELQWLGVPAVVSDHDDLPFAAAPELPVLPARDVDAWAEQLRALYDDPSELARLADAGRRFVREHNTLARNRELREELYAGAIWSAR